MPPVVSIPVGVPPSAVVTVGLTLIRPRYRAIGDLIAHVTVEEIHRDEVVVTDHPVERGAIISDHAYKTPNEVVIRCGWSNSRLEAGDDENFIDNIYDRLQKLQVAFIPFTIFTGKRKYDDMLLRSLMVSTDRNSENVLEVTAICRQVILVDTRILPVASDPHVQSIPTTTQPTSPNGHQILKPAPNVNGGATTVAPDSTIGLSMGSGVGSAGVSQIGRAIPLNFGGGH